MIKRICRPLSFVAISWYIFVAAVGTACVLTDARVNKYHWINRQGADEHDHEVEPAVQVSADFLQGVGAVFLRRHK